MTEPLTAPSLTCGTQTSTARFRSGRSQRFFDLLELVHRRPEMRVADLGCGPGELTRQLHDILEAYSIVGVDNSEAMLAQSDRFAGQGRALRTSGPARLR